MAKYKKIVYNPRRRVDTPTEDIQVSKQNGEKKVAENYCQVLSSRGSFGSLVSGKLILFPVSSGQRAGIFSVTGEEPNT